MPDLISLSARSMSVDSAGEHSYLIQELEKVVNFCCACRSYEQVVQSISCELQYLDDASLCSVLISLQICHDCHKGNLQCPPGTFSLHLGCDQPFYLF